MIETKEPDIEKIRSKHEFLTFLLLTDDDWRCGVVQNKNKRFITYYDINKIHDSELLSLFMTYADKWWWESGMMLPIDCFIGHKFDVFHHALVILPVKMLMKDPIGPIYSITEHYLKRVKKRKIDLINRCQK